MLGRDDWVAVRRSVTALWQPAASVDVQSGTDPPTSSKERRLRVRPRSARSHYLHNSDLRSSAADTTRSPPMRVPNVLVLRLNRRQFHRRLRVWSAVRRARKAAGSNDTGKACVRSSPRLSRTTFAPDSQRDSRCHRSAPADNRFAQRATGVIPSLNATGFINTDVLLRNQSLPDGCRLSTDPVSVR